MKADLLTAAPAAEVNSLSLMELEFSLGFYNRTGIVQKFSKAVVWVSLSQFHFYSVVVLSVEAPN